MISGYLSRMNNNKNNAVVGLVKTAQGWALDQRNTREASELQELFGSTIIPLPLTSTCSREYAWHFALGTEVGKQYTIEIW